MPDAEGFDVLAQPEAEPTSALDVSVQAAVLNLLVDLQDRTGVSYVFVSHDLGVVRYIADRVAVLYQGRVVEVGTAAEVTDGPHHPYTEALLSAGAHEPRSARVSQAELDASILQNPASTGCPYQPRCVRSVAACTSIVPELIEPSPGHTILCRLPVEDLGGTRGKRRLLTADETARLSRDTALPDR